MLFHHRVNIATQSEPTTFSILGGVVERGSEPLAGELQCPTSRKPMNFAVCAPRERRTGAFRSGAKESVVRSYKVITHFLQICRQKSVREGKIKTP